MPKKKRRPARRQSPVVYAADRTLGIILFFSAVIGVCWGSVAAILGSVLGRSKSGLGGTHLMVSGVLSAVVFVVMLFASVQIMGSSRRGFKLAMGCAVVNILLGAASLPYGALGVVLGVVIIYCCRQRTSGKQGPPLSS